MSSPNNRLCHSARARNDFELRRLMELDPAAGAARVAGPEETRRRTARRKLRLQMKDPSEETMSGGLAARAAKRPRYLAKPR